VIVANNHRSINDVMLFFLVIASLGWYNTIFCCRYIVGMVWYVVGTYNVGMVDGRYKPENFQRLTRADHGKNEKNYGQKFF